MPFRTDVTIDPVEPGRLLAWRAHDRQEQLQGSRLVEPSGPRTSRFTEVVEGRLLAESFFASLKGECLDQQPWPTRTAARRATVEYIAWYNGTRLHSTLGFMTPDEFETASDKEVIKQVA